MLLNYYALCQSRIKISQPEDDAVPLHLLQKRLVSRQQRRPHDFRHCNVGGIVDGDLVGAGDGIRLSQEVSRELVNFQVQIVKQLKC